MFQCQKLIVVAVSLAVLAPCWVWADDSQDNECSFWCQREKELAAPFSAGAVTPLLVGAGLTAGTLAFKKPLVYDTQDEIAQDKPLGKFSVYGDMAGQLIPNAAYVTGMLIHSWAGGSAMSLASAAVMFKATAYAGVTAMVVKSIVQEPRPDDSDHRSFPSGHTTTAFAFAAAIQQMHGWYWGVPAYALAAFVGLSRINDNKHYLQDVMAGATIGTAYGIGIAQLDGFGEGPESVDSAKLLLTPSKDLRGVEAQYEIPF